jgi:hypothetical protein
MKRFLLVLGALLALVGASVYAQYEIRNTPVVLDPEKEDYVRDYLKIKLTPRHLLPTALPLGADPNRKGPERLMSEDGFEIINISNASQFQSETWIQVNPHNPDVVVASCNDSRYNGGNYRMGAFTSTDQGKTWSQSTTPPNLGLYIDHPGADGGLTNVDPGLGYDTEGNVYYVYLFAQLIGTGAGDNGIFVTKSTDNGRNWEEPVPAVLDAAGTTNQPLNDKCFMAVDHYPESPYGDYIYVVWYRADYPNSAVGFVRSKNGYEFSSYKPVNGATGSIQSPYPVVGPDGTFYVAWESKDQLRTDIYIQKSTNGGDGFVWPGAQKVQTVKTCGERVDQRQALASKQNMRISSHPGLAIDPNNGNLYVVQAGKDDMDQYGIYLAKSTDGGNTWNSNNRIDNNDLRNDMFMPAITVDPVTGIVAVMYYSSQNVPENNGADVYVAVSFDEGTTFENFRITPKPFYFLSSNSVMPAGGAHLGYYWGDYSSITAYDGRIYPCFWMPDLESAPQSQVYWSNDIYTALIYSGPKPPQNVTYENNYEEPNKIILNWDDPTTNMLGGPMNDFKVVVVKDGNELAVLDKGVQTYTYNELQNGEHFTFHLKTRIPSGQESNIVSISGVSGGALKPMPPTDFYARPNENGIQLYWTNPEEHIDGSYFFDFDQIVILDAETDDLLATIETDDERIEPGVNVSYLLEVPTEKFYHLKIAAVGKRGDTFTSSDNSSTVLAYSGSPMTSLNENFDAETIIPYYTNGEWGLTQAIAFDGEYSFTDSPEGTYQRNATNRVYFAPQVVSNELKTLSFVHICNVEPNDVAALTVSNDFGETWRDLRWYSMESNENFTGDLETSDWVEQHLDISEFVGDTLWIQFYMVTNQFKEEDGWYIDDLKIDDNPNTIFDQSNSLSVEVFPNPSNGNVNLTLENAMAGNSIIECYDGMGNKIFNVDSGYMIAGRHDYKLDFSQYSSGIYYIRYTVDGTTKTIPVSIVK